MTKEQETEKFNNDRTETWVKKMTQDKARIYLMIGFTEDGKHKFLTDEALTPHKVAEKLERIAKQIREQL